MNTTEYLYKQLYLIRKTEDTIRDVYFDDEMKTPMHMSKGSEAIAVSVVGALGKSGQYCGTYRTHALYLAASADLDGFFAEIYGKAAGCTGGRGGSMHLFSPDAGVICTTAIVATNIPVGIGAAFVNKNQNNGKWVAVFFGDGAVDEGAFWESLNFACLRQLPVLFIYEDNDYAVHSKADDRHGYNSILDIVRQFECGVYDEESNDVELMQTVVRKAVASSRPSFIRFPYYRYLEHVGVSEDFGPYRQRAEMDEWLAKDPLVLQRSRLSQSVVGSIEQDIDQQVEAAVSRAKSLPFPTFDEEIFCE